jgi:hypothetical protein
MNERHRPARRPRDPHLSGYALPKSSQVDVAAELPYETSRIVFRPGLWQYAYILLLLALPVAFGISMIQYGFTIQERDWGNRIFFGLLMIAIGAVPAAYFLGMRIEVDNDNVSKVYLFGLLRSAIARDRIHATAHTESSRGWDYTRVDFGSVDENDNSLGFSVYPSWVWRSSDVDKLLTIAARSDLLRAEHPIRLTEEWRPSIGIYLREVATFTYVCVWGAIVPVGALYQNWGGPAAIVGVVMIESSVIVLTVLAVWSKRRRPALNTFLVSLLFSTGILGFVALLPETALMARSATAAALLVSGGAEAVAIVIAAIVTWRLSLHSTTSAGRQWQVVRSRRDTPQHTGEVVLSSEASGSNPGLPTSSAPAPHTASPARPTDSVRASDLQAIRPTAALDRSGMDELVSPPTERRGRGRRGSKTKQESDETGWALVLSFAAFLALVLGIWAATQSHSWTPLWPLNVVGGLMSYIPTVIWIAYGGRVPRRPLLLWPARTIALVMTFAIPQIIWTLVPGPPS